MKDKRIRHIAFQLAILCMITEEDAIPLIERLIRIINCGYKPEPIMGLLEPLDYRENRGNV